MKSTIFFDMINQGDHVIYYPEPEEGSEEAADSGKIENDTDSVESDEESQDIPPDIYNNLLSIQ